MRLLLGLLLFAAAAFCVFDVGGAQRPMAKACFGAVSWALQPVADSARESTTRASTPSRSPTPTP